MTPFFSRSFPSWPRFAYSTAQAVVGIDGDYLVVLIAAISGLALDLDEPVPGIVTVSIDAIVS